MYRPMLIEGVLGLAMLGLAGCSVGMAASGHKYMDTSIVFPGSNRAVIISKLGAPETSRKLENGKRQDSYLIKEGNESSSGRAWAHAGLDLMSFGLWELVATPYELVQGEESYRLIITYGKDGVVEDVQKLGAKTASTPDTD